MTDLELLDLVNRAQEKQKGERGDPGVGIERTEQYDDKSFNLVLTNGAQKKINLPTPKDGEVGPQGVVGPKGDPGPPGRDGRNGKDGLQGEIGPSGQDGVSLDTAVVNSNGHLLLGLTNGSVVDVGRVVGPAGATGERGLTGLSGPAGIDGNSCITGFEPPSQDLGNEGDSYIDCSSAEFAFYRKSGGDWTNIANLRQPAKDRLVGAGANAGGSTGNGGSGGGSGGGGSSEVHVGPNAPAFPETGTLWFDTSGDDGRLFIRVGDEWQPVLPQPELNGYAKQTYVDAQDNALGARIDGCATSAALQNEATLRDTGDKVNLGLIEANKDDIEELDGRVTSNTQAIAAIPPAPNLDNYAKKSDLAQATAALPYTIETDKTLRQVNFQHPEDYDADVRYAGGEIYLTDNLGFYSNVRFTGVNNITTSSDAQGIIVDGADLMPKNLLSLPELT